jgi:predicted ATPase
VTRAELPTGRITFVFTDIAGSTRLLRELGPARYANALAEHRTALRDAFRRHGGVEVDTQGDAFFYAFPTRIGAVAAASDAQTALERIGIRVRIGIHCGSAHVTDEGYVGDDVHKAARIAAAGYGGQILLSKETLDGLDVATLDLGEHRLKDIDEPVWIHQLGERTFPPLETISNTNLPCPVGPFVGRDGEVNAVVSLLRAEARLVTLTGPGGTGKTRLSIAATAAVVSDFRNGVFWVPLAAVRDPAVVGETIAATVGARDDLAGEIAEREMLLVIDNFEQVVDAAPTLADLLEACPNLRVLVSSRELLRVRGEVEFRVPALAMDEAVELFRLRSGIPGNDVIADLCRRLDNLPLAVELAAARARAIPPERIVDRLSSRLDLLKGGRDTDPRQATLRATIDWSFELLTDEEKELFVRLAVFHGGWTLEAAEAVVDADLDVLQSLVEKSLVRHDEGRYSMLETIRAYGVEKLDARADAPILRRRHAGYFVAISSEAQPRLREIALRGPGDLLQRLERDHDNLRAALEHLQASGESLRALGLAANIAEFWYQNGHLAEGDRRIEALLADAPPSEERALALIGASDLAASRGDSERALARAREAAQLYRSIGHKQGLGDAVWRVGSGLGEVEEWRAAAATIEEAIAIYRALDDQHALLGAVRSLAWAYENLGEPGRCRVLHEENLERARALGNELIEATTLGALAMNAVVVGRPQDALPLLRENTPIYARVGDAFAMTENLCRIAHATATIGDHAPAAHLLGFSERFLEEREAHVHWLERMNAVTRARLEERADPDILALWLRAGARLSMDDAVALALDVLRTADSAAPTTGRDVDGAR